MTLRAVLICLALAACQPQPTQGASELEALMAQPKFQASLMYTGAGDDAEELTKLVNSAIADIDAMSDPPPAADVRARLGRLVTDVDLFETEDREQAYKYAIRIWRAAGFKEESGLFPVPDSRTAGEP